MAGQTKQEREVKVLQENLTSIRRIAGWTMEDLGRRIGVTKQTVSNWEKEKSLPMNLTQYIAIRAVLDAEIAESNNEVLKEVVAILLDAEETAEEADEEAYREAYNAVKEKIKIVAAAAAGGLTGAALTSTYASIVGPVAGGLVVAGAKIGLGVALGPVGLIGSAAVATTPWLLKMLKRKKK